MRGMWEWIPVVVRVSMLTIFAFVGAVPPQVSRDIVKDATATPVAFEASASDPGR